MTDLQVELRTDVASVVQLLERFRALDRKHDQGVRVLSREDTTKCGSALTALRSDRH
jgi:hypothetical protein